MTLSRRSVLLSCAAAAPWVATRALAESRAVFPHRPITWVLPYPPGGFGDASSRLMAQHMTDTLKWPVVVDSRPGAGGQIAAAHVKQMPADGHTLFNGDMGSFAMNAALYQKLNYDMFKDFVPVTRLVTSSLALVVPASSPFKSFDDLVRAAQGANQGARILYGSFSIGSLSHLWVELLARQIGGRFEHVAYKGSAQALQDLMGERIDMMVDLVANTMAHVHEGKLRALAVMGSDKRLARLPQVPTLKEMGHGLLDAAGWSGLAVRTGTPADAIHQLHAAAQRAVQSDEMKRRYSDLGIAPAPQGPADFLKYIHTETERWGSVIRSAGVLLG